MEPLIIECSLNEQVTKDRNASVPISKEEVVADALAAADAGAAILHFHARDEETGDLLHPGTEWYRDVMRAIRRENPEVLLYPTYGASPTPEDCSRNADRASTSPSRIVASTQHSAPTVASSARFFREPCT